MIDDVEKSLSTTRKNDDLVEKIKFLLKIKLKLVYNIKQIQKFTR